MYDEKYCNKFLQFGCPYIQNLYKKKCQKFQIPFDEFQLRLIDETNRSYDELKTFYVDGLFYPLKKILKNKICEVNLEKFLIIHFDYKNIVVFNYELQPRRCFRVADTDMFFEYLPF